MKPQKPVLLNSPKPRRGFALVVTISLMVLLSLLAIGILGLSSVTLRSSRLGAAESEARANARLALILALGELQKTMGPDQRISARAETLAMHPKLNATVTANTPRAWWVGAAHSDPEQSPSTGSGTTSGGRAVTWLVSGLDPTASPAEQISNADPFDNPVDMYGDKTIDLTATGGRPIQAGSVAISDDQGQNGGFAYFIDDNGMKAQLAAANPEVRNDARTPKGSGVISGTYDIGVLEGMEDMEGVPLEDYNKLLSLNDLPLIGADLDIVRRKRLGYTTLARGVLSDVRKGGLKRDLTIAFERDNVFDAVLSNNAGRGGAFNERYVVMDEEKFDQAPELASNGYIHWDMFKDYYNLKKHIQSQGSGRSSNEYLDSIMISKIGLFNGFNNTPFGRGQLGPHAIGPNSSVPSQHQQIPYGDIDVIDPPSKTEFYKHSPLIPILSKMQQNAWVELLPAEGRGKNQRLRTNVQLWKSQYNPYNIHLNVKGDADRFGPRFIHYPQVSFTIDGLNYKDEQGQSRPFSNINGFSGKRQSSVPRQILLGPGRSHVCAFKDYGVIGRDNDEFLYDDAVRDLTLQSIYSDRELTTNLRGGSYTIDVDFVLDRPSMMHGANSNSYNANHEVAQTMWAPFAWEAIRNSPGKRISMSNIRSRGFTENNMASFTFKLRTTREGSGSLRPLIDSNIRALLCNTKWDSPLGVELLAGYSPENQGVTEDQIFQMNTSDAPRGYTYWGGGNDPADGYDRVILFDVPRQDLVSIGQLQHAGVGRFSYEPTYIVGNSYANLRIPLDGWRGSVSDSFSTEARGLASNAIPGRFNLYDASYLVNEELWDSYTFTTIPQIRDNRSGTDDLSPTSGTFEQLLAGDEVLPNPRFIPYEPEGSSFDMEILHMESGSRGQTGGFYHNAGHLLVDGAFNVNSTSIDAWEAFLSGTHGLPYQKMNAAGRVTGFSTANEEDGVRFPRVQSVLGEGTDKDSLDENYWIGFRNLSSEEIRELAEAIVAEVKQRGPFLTFGEFVNRRLETGDLGERGALQAALDATVNNDLDSNFAEEATHPKVPRYSSQGAGFPGQLLQGDILQALSPCMTVRSDTFTIRAYGESRNSSTGELEARAWCEATVQRFPDPVENSDSNGDALSELIQPSSEYGRSFRTVSFRWLSAKEI